MKDSTRKRITAAIDAEAEPLKQLALDIHANPELAFEEVKAAGWLCEYLKQQGFEVERPVAGLQTAFRATAGSGKPTVAFMSEYDALPGIGHGCGHNLIAIAGAAAGVGLKAASAELGATVQVLGTPGEESLGGKVSMVHEGVFQGVDFAMMVHPSTENCHSTGGTALQEVSIAFHGKASHAAASPEKGVHALDGLLLTFNGVNALRQHIKEDSRIHGIITDGGTKPNIVPDFAKAAFYVRSPNDEYLEELLQKVENVARGAALMTGAKVDFEKMGTRYYASKPCPILARVYQEEGEALGLKFEPSSTLGRGSSDFGHVSRVVPALHSYFAIAPKEQGVHSVQFAECARLDAAIQTALVAAKALALAAARVIEDGELLAEIKRECVRRNGNAGRER